MRIFFALSLLALVASCTDGAAEEDEGMTRTFVAGRFSFLEFDRTDDGATVSRGFDLDGRDSDLSDIDGCRVADYRDAEPMPDAVEPFTEDSYARGIDNQFSAVWALIPEAARDSLAGLIQNSINDGTALIMFEVSDVEDWVNDDQVTVAVFSGTGAPLLTADGAVANGQTMDVRTEAAYGETNQGSIENGLLEAGPMNVELPVSFFNINFNLRLNGARIRARIDPETGEASGLIGGGTPVEAFLEVLREGADQDSTVRGLLPVAESQLPALADLGIDADGFCQDLSAYLEFDAVEAFVYDDAVWPEGREVTE